jgi:nitrogen fixation/metabolism regulation signal transduction histidine kinase
MKPLKAESQDAETLRELGSASVQVVHDLKNQLNGLKLYATFLRKRMEKTERPADELETVAKLIAGLERAAADTTLLVRYGRPLELRRQPGTDLARLLVDASSNASVAEGNYEGDFDPSLIAEALKNITRGGRGEVGAEDESAPVRLSREAANGAASAVIEWRGASHADGDADPFKSFAGGEGLRMALAAKIIRAHGGEVAREGGVTRARLPLSK